MRAKGRSPFVQYGVRLRALRTGAALIWAWTLTLLLPWLRKKLSIGQVADQLAQKVVVEGGIALIHLSVLNEAEGSEIGGQTISKATVEGLGMVAQPLNVSFEMEIEDCVMAWPLNLFRPGDMR